MDVHDCIRTRRSVRKYAPEPVSDEVIGRVLEAVRWAPSWVNFQPWELILVEDPRVRQALAECVPESNPGRRAVVTAPVLLALCGRLGESGYYRSTQSTVHGDWVMFDLGIASQNLCLAAWAEGLGSLHLGLLDHDRAGDILGLPDNVRLYELIPLGRPERVGRAPERRPVTDFLHRNRWGK